MATASDREEKTQSEEPLTLADAKMEFLKCAKMLQEYAKTLPDPPSSTRDAGA